MKEVLGYYPNWLSAELYRSIRYDAVTTIAYAFVGFQSDGTLNKFNYFPDPLIQEAHSHNVKVVLSVNPDWGSSVINQMLNNPTSQENLVNNLYAEIQAHGWDGVDIDMEGMSGTSTQLVQFMQKLRNKLGNKWISIALPPVDWNSEFDTSRLSQICDYLMIMGYDYHWASGQTAGAVAPLYSSNGVSVTDSVNKYLQTIPKEKLLLGVPYYGYEWSTNGTQPDAPTNGGGITVKYTEAISKAAQHGRQWNTTWSSPYYVYGNNQGWYDDTESLGLKYDLVNQKEIGGIGIWALGYDNNHELADLILQKFAGYPTPTTTLPQEDIITPTMFMSALGIVISYVQRNYMKS